MTRFTDTSRSAGNADVSEDRRWALTAIASFLGAIACFVVASEADLSEMNTPFWTEKNFTIGMPRELYQPDPEPPAATSGEVPVTRFGPCEDCPPSFGELLLSATGVALIFWFLVSLYKLVRKPEE